jgi:hypothetical protein
VTADCSIRQGRRWALTETQDRVEATVRLVDVNVTITFANAPAKAMLPEADLSGSRRCLDRAVALLQITARHMPTRVIMRHRAIFNISCRS